MTWAAVLSNESALIPLLNSQSLSHREAFSLNILNFASLPHFSLSLQPPQLHLASVPEPVQSLATLSFPTFPEIDDPAQQNYVQASWQAAYLAWIEALYPAVLPRATAEDWLASFDLSYAHRPRWATRLGSDYADSDILLGSDIQPRPRQLLYDLSGQRILNPDDNLNPNDYYEIFNLSTPTQLEVAVVLNNHAWIVRHVDDQFVPHFAGPLAQIPSPAVATGLHTAAAEWGLAALTYFNGSDMQLLQVRFDVANLLHPDHHNSFVQVFINHLAAQRSHD